VTIAVQKTAHRPVARPALTLAHFLDGSIFKLIMTSQFMVVGKEFCMMVEQNVHGACKKGKEEYRGSLRFLRFSKGGQDAQRGTPFKTVAPPVQHAMPHMM
jgi:hypothetical protein